MCELCMELGHVCFYHCPGHMLRIHHAVDLFIIQEIHFMCEHCKVSMVVNRQKVYQQMTGGRWK